MNKFLKRVSICMSIGVVSIVVPNNGFGTENTTEYYSKTLRHDNKNIVLTYLSNSNWDIHSASVANNSSISFRALTAEQLSEFIDTVVDLRHIAIGIENKLNPDDFITKYNGIRSSTDKQFEIGVLEQIFCNNLSIIKKEVISGSDLCSALDKEEIARGSQGLRVTTRSIDGNTSAIDLLIAPKYTGSGYNRAKISILRIIQS